MVAIIFLYLVAEAFPVFFLCLHAYLVHRYMHMYMRIILGGGVSARPLSSSRRASLAGGFVGRGERAAYM